MPFVLIRGTFHVVGYSPDGDSVRFEAVDEANWGKLSGPPVELNARRHAQLRFEGIDTLETHYRGEHQPLGLATGALTRLLSGLGIGGTTSWDEQRTQITAADDGTAGHVLSRAADDYGRPVAFVFPGEPPEADGSEVFLDAEALRGSLNHGLLEEGLAYPTYYRGLFADLRGALTEAVARAREAGLGVWAEDRTNSGCEVESLASITDGQVILPKLFRRLVEYLGAGGPVAGFEGFLEARGEGVTVIPTAHFTHLDTVVEVDRNTVRMTERPEDLVFEG